MSALRATVSAANDGLWDRLFGVETAGRDCRPTAYRVLFKIFRALDLRPEDRFLDFGCGRGRTLCLAARYPVERVGGVELNPVTAQGARDNLAAMHGRRAVAWFVETGSAADFDCSGGTVFYFYNPFGGALFEQVIDNVRAAVCRPAGPPARIVYVNPVCREILDRADWLGEPQVVHVDGTGRPAVLLYRQRFFFSHGEKVN